MTRKAQATPPPPWQSQEAELLKRLFTERATLSQEEFGAKYEIGSQGMVWQYLNGHRPLNINAATGFALGLNAGIGQFSPRLAHEIERAHSVVGPVVDAPRKQAPPRTAAQALIEEVIRAAQGGVSDEKLNALRETLRLFGERPTEPFDVEAPPH